MTLDTENAKLFFKLFLPMLDYVNLKCHVLENDEKFMEKWTLFQGINVQSALKTANKLWSDDTLIDDYLAQAQLSDENRDIVSSWKNTINNLRNYPKIYRYALWLYICIFQYWYMFFKRLSCGQWLEKAYFRKIYTGKTSEKRFNIHQYE